MAVTSTQTAPTAATLDSTFDPVADTKRLNRQDPGA